MMLASVMAVVAASVLFVLFVRVKDIPAPEPVSPTKHLEERKAAIYENLRDLQFEYRVGKLSDADYQQTKLGLQKELAGVIAEMNKITAAVAAGQPAPVAAPKVEAKPKPKEETATVCPHCGAKFAKAMKFCGECGKPMVSE
jgi:hypothetical protein